MEYEILLRKGLDLSVRTFALLVRILYSTPPSVLSIVCLAVSLYKCYPTLFYLLVSFSPVIICTAVFLGFVLSFGDLNFVPEIEEEKQEEELNKNTENDNLGVDVPEIEVEKQEEELNESTETDNLGVEEDDTEWIFVSTETDDKLATDENSLTNYWNGEVDDKTSFHEGEGVSGTTCEEEVVVQTWEGGKTEIEAVEVEGSVDSSKDSFESWAEHMEVHYGSNSYYNNDSSSSAPSDEDFATILLEECKPLLEGHPSQPALFGLSDSDSTLEQSLDDDTSFGSDDMEEEWGVVERKDGKILVDWGVDDVEESLMGQRCPHQIGEDSDSSEAEVERYSYLELIRGISQLEESKVKAFNCKLPELDFSEENGLKLPIVKTRPMEDTDSAFNLLRNELSNPGLVFLDDETVERNERWLSNEDHLILELPVHNARASVELLAGGVHDEPIKVESLVDKPELPAHESQIPKEPESGASVGHGDLVLEKLTEDDLENLHESSEC
ncbi:hypothetical protein C5167_003278 [Papaver somniferum]|uniref:Uncharacterized protein n=1 Tax=Papaver somniferum TaxID=3469 RepID=A0A4Y7L281_PAPSO|nr:hypothetical protein C5167_003278 [Papaver somniferum]